MGDWWHEDNEPKPLLMLPTLRLCACFKQAFKHYVSFQVEAMRPRRHPDLQHVTHALVCVYCLRMG
jgi:hypothetical protein